MVSPIITVRGDAAGANLEALIQKQIEKLTRYHPKIIAANVLVAPATRRHRNGNRYHVRIEISVPGEDVVVVRDAGVAAAVRSGAATRARKSDELRPDHRDAKVAIREAFEAARRRLQDAARRRRGATKVHTPPPKVLAAEGVTPSRRRTRTRRA